MNSESNPQPIGSTVGNDAGSDIGDKIGANRANWDARVPVHLGPDGYRVERLVEDAGVLSNTVAFDKQYLGDLTGLEAVHLQCHIGTDTLSLARLGAEISGLDFSPKAIVAARSLAEQCGTPARFVEGDVYDAPRLLGATYDLVYTGVGAINWLPDIGRWAKTVEALLKPGGRVHLTEGHPSAMILSDDALPDDMIIEYPYFDGTAVMTWNDSTSYLGSGEVTSPEHHEWAHNPAAVIQSLIDVGLVIDRFDEHRTLPWPLLPWMEPDQDPDREGWFVWPARYRDSIPLSYTVQAHRPTDR